MKQKILDLQRQLEMLKSGRSPRSVAPEEEEDLHREERPEGGPTRGGPVPASEELPASRRSSAEGGRE